MHELSLMKNIIGILDREVVSDEVGAVKMIHLEVGVLRYIVPDLMVSAYEQISKHKKLEQAELKIDVLPVKIKCLDCKAVAEALGNDFSCPECSSANVNISGGDEFTIKGIEW